MTSRLVLAVLMLVAGVVGVVPAQGQPNAGRRRIVLDLARAQFGTVAPAPRGEDTEPPIARQPPAPAPRRITPPVRQAVAPAPPAPGEATPEAPSLATLDVQTWAAASYAYNFNRPSPRRLSPGGVLSNAFHPDHNNFQLDELWITIERPVDAASRAGLRFDLAYGKVGQIGLPTATDPFYVDSAYAEYAPSRGTRLRAGLFPTPIGYEVIGATRNATITRGLVWNLMQPINHVGLWYHAGTGRGASVGAGLANGFDVNQPDSDAEKDVLWHAGYAGDAASIAFNGLFGWDLDSLGAGTTERDSQAVLNAVGTWEPSEATRVWIDWTWRRFNLFGFDRDPSLTGVSLGVTSRLHRRLGQAVRAEWGRVSLGDNPRVAEALGFAGIEPGRDAKAYSLTGTLEVELTSQSYWRNELKWESVRGIARGLFPRGQVDFSDDQLTWLSQFVVSPFGPPE